MLLDHDNLLSTFGKDSQSSNRKNSEIKQAVKNKRTCLNYHDIEPKNKYEQILSQRKNLMLLQKRQFNQKTNNKNVQRHQSKKIKTQSDIEHLNNKIRKSISGIAQTICKSKITHHNNHQSNKKLNQFNQPTYYNNNNRQSLTKKATSNNIIPSRIQSMKQIKNFQSSINKQSNNKHGLKSSRFVQKDKQNVGNFMNRNYNNCNGSSSGNGNNNFNELKSISNKVRHQQHHCMKSGYYIGKQDTLRNSTKKKARFFQSNNQIDIRINDCPIKSSFSIDLNSQHRHKYNDSTFNNNRQHLLNNRQQSSRIHTETFAQNHCSKFQLPSNNSNTKQTYQPSGRLSSQRQQQYRSSLSKLKHISVGNRQKNEDTLKKQFKQLMLVESNYIELPKLTTGDGSGHINSKINNSNSNKFMTRTTVSSCSKDSARNNHNNNNNNVNKIFQSYNYKNSYNNKNKNTKFYTNYNKEDINYNNSINNQNNRHQHKTQQSQLQYQPYQQNQQSPQQQKSPNFNNIHVPKKLSLYDIKKHIRLYDDIKQKHPLIIALMQQIQLDYDLRHAKHMFSGIEEPFSDRLVDNNNKRCNMFEMKQSSSKWHILNQQLTNRGLNYSVQTIKKIFLPSQQQLDPFLSVTQPHDELIHSLIYAYETAQIHWQQTIYKKWQHWDLRQIDLTIQNIDRQRKGYITVQDIAAFVSMQTGKEYKNRDVILIYKRLMNNFVTMKNNNNTKKYDHDDNKFQSSSSNSNILQIEKNKLKFRSLIDCLIKNF